MFLRPNKLVRDKIPEIIEKVGGRCAYDVIEGKKLRRCLKEKLVEEANEVLKAANKNELINEIADIYEVLEEITMVFNIPKIEIEHAMVEKEVSKGSFSKHIFLTEVETYGTN